MPRRTPPPTLTPEQKAESDRIFAALQRTAADDLRALTDLLAATDDEHTFGATEYNVRDIAHRIGATAVETALEGRKQGGITAPPIPGGGGDSLERGAAGPSAVRVRADWGVKGVGRAAPESGRAGRDGRGRPVGSDLGRGGAGIEDWLRENFPRVGAVILGFCHVAEYLSGWAKVLHPEGGAAAGVAKTWCHRLKHEGGAAVLADLTGIDLAGRSEVVREAHRVLLVYFGNQVHRMDYPTYRAKGWLIGSGPVEAACKQVVGQRKKGTRSSVAGRG